MKPSLLVDHALVVTDDGYHRCTLCGRSWKTPPELKCPGAPIYRWDAWPAGLFTRKQLATKGLVPGPLAGVIPYEKSADGDGWLRIYRESEATARPPLTPAQQTAVEKMKAAKEAARHCTHCGCWLDYHERGTCDRCFAARTAMDLITAGDFVIWDSETTDLNGRFVELAVVDPAGRVLFDHRIRPGELCSVGAYDVHGILDEELASAPHFYEVYDELRAVLDDQRWVIYNADFDTAILDNECNESEYRHYFAERPIKFRTRWCAMELYAQFHNDYRGRGRGYRWQKLSEAYRLIGQGNVPKSAHSALGDCLRTLEVLYGMAEWYRKANADE